MNSEERDLLALILAEPESDNHRLVYADWLEEQGDGARAEFIRVQIELTKEPQWLDVPFLGSEPGKLKYSRVPSHPHEELRQRESLLMTGYGQKWLTKTPLLQMPTGTGWTWSRGFIESVECRLGDWMKHGPALVQQQPIQRVVITDHELKPFQGKPHTDDWLLTPRHVPEALEPYMPKMYHFSTKQAALDSLSAACILWAKNEQSPSPIPGRG